MNKRILLAWVAAPMFALAAASAPAQPANGPGAPSSKAYGPGYHMGSGMMGGRGGGYGMGPRMMDEDDGACGWGMGPWMMGGSFGPGSRALASLDLNAAQVQKIESIQDAREKKQWQLMTAMHDAMLADRQGLGRQPLDVDAVMKTAEAVSNIRLQMMRNRLEAQKQIWDALTAPQQEQLRRYGLRD